MNVIIDRWIKDGWTGVREGWVNGWDMWTKKG